MMLIIKCLCWRGIGIVVSSIKSCRAECYELAGDIRKAIKCIEKFITNTPDNLLIVKKCAKVEIFRPSRLKLIAIHDDQPDE